MPQFEDSANPVDPFAFLANYSDETLVATIQDTVATVGPLIDVGKAYFKRNEGFLKDMWKSLKSEAGGVTGALMTANPEDRDGIITGFLQSSPQVQRIIPLVAEQLAPLIMKFAAAKLREPETAEKMARFADQLSEAMKDPGNFVPPTEDAARAEQRIDEANQFADEESALAVAQLGVAKSMKKRGPFDPLA